MEIVGAVVAILECASAPITKCWKYHSGINKNMVTLKKRLAELNGQKGAIEARLKTELLSGETMLNNAVELWLERVENINVEIETIEEKVEKLKFCSRVDFGRNVIMKIEEVQELCKSHGEFPSSLVISLPKRGDALPTTTILGGSETTSKRKMEEIWASVMDDEVTKIGVYGMGGIGKTTVLEHINNRLLERQDKFDTVIWVTVSKDSDLTNLQGKIAYKLGVDISKDSDKITRAAELQKKFNTKKRFVLILDDLWEVYSLKEVGIPEPTLQNGCKLILSTRSLDVCRRMSCKPIRIELLSEDDALDLFLDTAGRNVLSAQNLEVTIKEIVKECAGLPLAVVIIAGSLKGTTDYNEWEVALEDLREATKGSTSDGIFERLKFSYDRLENKNLQDCLLYCALYPEDHEIERGFLIEHLIAEGIIEEKNTRHYDFKKGQVMLNKLVNVSLLNDTGGGTCVKIHDLVRDMALRITSESHRVLVKAGLRLKFLPGEEHWKDDVAKVSLVDNDISDIPPSIEPPKCPTLSTLLLCKNRFRSISDIFFLHMKGLNILDLSDNPYLQKLPESVSNLVALTALFLRGCQSLRHVPSLAKLGELRKLDCSGTGINEVPPGMEMLVKLKYLNFDKTRLKMIPDEILCKLTNLQYLSFNRHAPRGSTWLKLRGKQLEKMRKLETFEGVLYDVNNFNTFVKCLEHQRLVSYVLQLGFIDGLEWEPVLSEGDKVALLIKYGMSESEAAGGYVPLLLLPKDVEFLAIHDCRINVRNLCELTSLNNVTKLRSCYISKCGKIEHVFSYSPSIFSLLQSLEELFLVELQELRGLICREREAESPLPPGTFSSLKKLFLIECNKIKRLIMVASLPNLEDLYLYNCEQLKEIIFTISIDDNNDDGDQNEEGRTDHDATNIISCPKLTTIALLKLPELQRIPVVAGSLQEIKLWECPKLKRIPPLDREPCPPSLQHVRIDEESWESLEWDHLNAKRVIQSLRENDNDH